MYIKRHLEQQIEKLAKQYPVIIVTGPRQVGKSTVLKHLFAHSHQEITFDNPVLLNAAKEDGALFFKTHKPPVFLDEVQYVPELFPYIKMQADKFQKDGDFIMTGSQSFNLMNNASESLAGRVGILEMLGLSLREIHKQSFHKAFIPTEEYIEERKDEIKPYKNLWSLIHRGSMPRLARKDIDWDTYYASYVKTYIERDVRQLTQIENEDLFYKFMVAIAARTGELLNYNNVANSIGVSIDTVKRWLSILKASGLVYIMEPFYNNALQRLVKTPKLYFLDTGLVCFLTKWNTADALQNGAKAGNIFETFVVAEIIKSFLNSGKTILPLYFYRDNDQREIDLLIENNGTLYPVEIKMTASPRKDMCKQFKLLDKISGHKRGMGIVLCQIDDVLYLEENTIALPIEYV